MKKLLAAAAVGAMATLFFAASAGATEPKLAESCKTVTSNITDRPDSAPGGYSWALDTFKRTVEICHAPVVATIKTEGKYWQYTAKGTDAGTFKTSGVKSFNGSPMKSGVDGTFSGSFSMTFTGPAEWAGFKDSEVKDNNKYSTSEWLAKLWTTGGYEAGKDFKWGWTYKVCNETLTNASTGNSGNITGYSLKACVTVVFKDTCTGIEVTVKNGASFEKAWAWLKFNNDKPFGLAGGATKTVTLSTNVEVFQYVGEHNDDKSIVAETAKSKWKLIDSHKWVKPNTCASTSVTPSVTSGPTAPGSGGSLPVTGSKTWIVAGSGALLIAIGVAALLVARKRDETKFIAE